MNDDLAAQVRAIALDIAEGLEASQSDVDFWDGLFQDVLEVSADTRGWVVLLLGTGGPQVELQLGDGAPRVEVWWGSEHFACPIRLDGEQVDEQLGALWHAAIARALSDPPYEDY